MSDACGVAGCLVSGPFVRGLCLIHAEEALSDKSGHSRRTARRAYYLKNQAVLKAKSAEWYRNNKERASKYHKARKANNPLPYFISHKRRRGLDYKDTQLERQGGVCDLCGGNDPGSEAGWHLDHDHAFDSRGGDRNPVSFRGVLCAVCNTKLVAAAEESPRYRVLMPKVDEYLVRWAKVINDRVAETEREFLPGLVARHE